MNTPTLSLLELEAVIPLSEKPKKTSAKYAKRTKEMTVERITSLSRETIERQFPQYIITLSERRKGMKIKHALAIAGGNIA